jgi:hypothetical protein
MVIAERKKFIEKYNEEISLLQGETYDIITTINYM